MTTLLGDVIQYLLYREVVQTDDEQECRVKGTRGRKASGPKVVIVESVRMYDI